MWVLHTYDRTTGFLSLQKWGFKSRSAAEKYLLANGYTKHNEHTFDTERYIVRLKKITIKEDTE